MRLFKIYVKNRKSGRSDAILSLDKVVRSVNSGKAKE